MTFSEGSRWFLSAALTNLAVAAGLVLAHPSGALTTRWNALVWLLLIGFVGCATAGFALHLFPVMVRRPASRRHLPAAAFVLTETGVVLGSVALYGSASSVVLDSYFALAAGFEVVAVALVLFVFAEAMRAPRRAAAGLSSRPGDVVTVPLFFVSWTSALVADMIFVLSGLSVGPGFGWWLAAVHLFVLGHVLLLVGAVSLRLVPRSLDADAPRAAVLALAATGIAGAILVPTGMLTTRPGAASALTILAAPEAAFAVLLLALLLYLGRAARTPRSPLALQLTSVVILLAGGGLGLAMLAWSNYAPVDAHAILNVLGFVGLTIMVMWFAMLAPFQRVSHAWTRRMRWILSSAWLAGVIALALAGLQRMTPSRALGVVGAGLLLSAAVAWSVGTLPVLFPHLKRLPRTGPGRTRALREGRGRK